MYSHVILKFIPLDHQDPNDVSAILILAIFTMIKVKAITVTTDNLMTHKLTDADYQHSLLKSIIKKILIGQWGRLEGGR